MTRRALARWFAGFFIRRRVSARTVLKQRIIIRIIALAYRCWRYLSGGVAPNISDGA
jgi:hypothetical protein